METLPTPFEVKVALAAGVKAASMADIVPLMSLFEPDRDWFDGAGFRAALEKHLGLPGNGGMFILPTSNAVACEPETMVLIEAYAKGPGAFFLSVGVQNPRELAWAF